MTLIKSISGIRGTIDGAIDGLTPFQILSYTAAFGTWVLRNTDKKIIVVGRDARISGHMVHKLVIGTLQSLGIHIIDLRLSTTPTIGLAVPEEQAGGGIAITASHNPENWNALKLFNQHGELINQQAGQEVLLLAQRANYSYAAFNQLGTIKEDSSYLEKHIAKIVALPLVDTHAITHAKFTIVVDAINSTGGLCIPTLLHALGVHTIHKVYCEPNGLFAHNPEPLPEHLKRLSQEVLDKKAHLGIAVDPDVDRLCFICENGEAFGEEYTLVAVADYVLQHTKGNTVSNLSSTQALRAITERVGAAYYPAAVGEVHVVEQMKSVAAVIGGEGNGGVIYPKLHYGRDALVGIALFLTHLAKSKLTISALRSTYPSYYMAKSKITLTDAASTKRIFDYFERKYSRQPHITLDGLKIMFDASWVHLRCSNTEPVMRIYAEAKSKTLAEDLVNSVISDINTM